MKNKSIAKKNRISLARIIISGGVFIALIVSLLLASAKSPFGKNNHEHPIETPQVVEGFAASHQEEYVLRHEFIGQVEAKQTSLLGFELPGVLNRIQVDEGDLVKSGDILAALDTSRLEAQRTEISAQIERASADVALGESTYERILEAYKVNAVAAHEKDEAFQSKEMRAAVLKGARAQLKRINIDLQKSILVAPFDGVIIVRSMDEGTVVSGGESVFTIQKTPGLNVRVGVTPKMLDQLQIGQQKTIYINQQKFQARVDAIVPAISSLRTVDVILTFENDAVFIRSGDMVRLPLERRVQEKGFWVPTQSLREGRRGLWSLYVIQPISKEDQKSRNSFATHIVSRRHVVVLNSMGAKTYVNGGVAENEMFVIKGAHKLVPDQEVTLSAPSEVSN